jgi:hypothetical protein
LGWHDVEPLGDILADPVQRSGAAGADHARHIDQRFNPRQMGRQCAPVRPAPGDARFALGRCRLLALGLAGRLDLFGLLQAQLELFLGQGLGPAAKAMTLQLLDDLAQPLALRPLGQHHRLEQVGIVWQDFGDAPHGAD